MRSLLWAIAVCAACAGELEPADCDLPTVYEKSPGAQLKGAGWHRLYLQGGSAPPNARGRYSMTEHRTEVAVGDHFLLTAGTLVEWTYPVAAPLSGLIAVHVAHVDDLSRYSGTSPIPAHRPPRKLGERPQM